MKNAKPKSRKVAWVVLGVVVTALVSIAMAAVVVGPEALWRTVAYRSPLPRMEVSFLSTRYVCHFQNEDEHWLDSYLAQSFPEQCEIRFQTKWRKRFPWLPGEDAILEPSNAARVRELVRRIHDKTAEQR